MPLLFKAKTNDSHVLKVLVEVLQNNIQTGYFILSKKNIKFRMMNVDKCILFDINLDSDNFEVYKFKSEENLMLGLNLTHFSK